jgi:hypothetical protein
MDPAMLGPYRLVAVLSRGPSATVYRALDTSHDDREVALKVFAPPLSADAAFRERFRRDAGLLSALREPHVVPIHRYGEIDGALYLDMRLVRGPSLADILRTGPLDPARARVIGQQIAAATEALRRSGLGERPLDRSDVLLTGPRGREFVQLVGLGLGRPPAGARPAELADTLVRPLQGWSPPSRRRRRFVAVSAAVVTVAAVLATVIAVARGGLGAAEQPVAEGPRGLVATISDVARGVVDADTAALDGRRVLVAATADGNVRTWDLTTGEVVRPAIDGDAVAVGIVTLDGRTVVVARQRDTTVTVHDLATGAQVGPTIGTPMPVPGPGEPVPSVRRGPVTVELDGRPVIVTPQETGALVAGIAGSEPQIGLQTFSIPDGAPAGPPVSEDGYSIGYYSVTEIEGRPVAVSLVENGTVQARDLGTGSRVGVGTPPQPALLGSLTTAVRDAVPVAVTGGADNAVRIWDLRSGAQIGSPLIGHTDSVAGLATVRLENRTVVISTAGTYPEPERAEARFWDLATGAPLGRPLVDHPVAWMLAATTDVEPALLVAVPPDGPVTVWDAHQLIQEVP